MKPDCDRDEETGLAFFGTGSALAAHEIKNALAIINENAGLLEDFTLMAEKGAPLTPSRIGKVAENLIKQVKRADAIVKNVGAFAHSANATEKTVDLNEVVKLLAALAGRLAARRSVTLEVSTAKAPVMLTTNPFLLENLIWLCLDHLIASAKIEGVIRMAAESGDCQVLLRISGSACEGFSCPDSLSEGRVKHLLSALSAELFLDSENRELLLRVPANANPSAAAVPRSKAQGIPQDRRG